MSNLEFEQEQEHVQQVQYGNRLEQEEPEEPTAPEIPPKEDEQLALFDEPKPAKKKKTGKPSPAKKAKTTEVVGTDYLICYAGHQIPVPHEKMTLEKVRAFLESDFPELSKDRTDMLLDKEQHQIIPVVKGAKKG